MESVERVRTALAGDRPDRVPCALGFFLQSLFGPKDADELFGTDVRFVGFAPPAGQVRFHDYLASLPPDVHVGSRSQLQTYYEWDYHPERSSSGSPASYRSLSDRLTRLLPRLTEPRRHIHLVERVRELHAAGLAVAGSPPHLGGELFESASRLRGFEVFMTDLLRHPDLVEYFLDQLTAMAAESAELLGRAGVDVLLLDDDVASCRGLLISPTLWRRFFKARLARIVEAGRRASKGMFIFYHSDGDFTALLADLVEIGVDVVNPVAPDCMDAAGIRRKFGPGLAMWGTVGTARAWDSGTPMRLREEVRARVESLGKSGLLLSPAYDLDFAARENVAAFVGAVRHFG